MFGSKRARAQAPEPGRVVGQIETPPHGLLRPRGRPTRTVPPWAHRAVVEEVLRLVGADGHGIYSEEAVCACGVSPAVVCSLARSHTAERGGGTPILGPDGQPKGAIWGVHGLALLDAVAQAVGVAQPPVASWSLAAWQTARALAQWVHAQGGSAPPLGPPPVPTVPPGMPGRLTPPDGVPDLTAAAPEETTARRRGPG